MAQGADALVPASGPHYQPLFSIYAKSCLPIAEKHLFEGLLKISDMFPMLTMRVIGEDEQRRHDPDLISFFNINTAADYERAMAMARGARAVTAAD
jgi:molybdopterin-guanine dinucleotide biosynthesis protein A